MKNDMRVLGHFRCAPGLANGLRSLGVFLVVLLLPILPSSEGSPSISPAVPENREREQELLLW